MARRWGWIPNLSGVAFDYESIRERLDSDAVRGNTWIHIQASPGPGDTVLINVVRTLSDDDSGSSRCGKEGDVLWNHTFHLVDPRGICYVEESESESPYIIESWKFLREHLDGCSRTVYNCSAMDNMIRSSDRDSIIGDLASTFMSTLESQTDYLARVVPDSGFYLRIAKSDIIRTFSLLESNRLYFDSFLDMFERELAPREMHRLRGELAHRKEKVAMVMEGLMGRFARFHSIGSLTVALAAVSISISGVLWA